MERFGKCLVRGQPPRPTTLTVAVAGNPNTGKSTLINALAGTSIQVGNWPGVTVEKREATITEGQKSLHLVDLPGVYSLTSRTPEEKLTRDFLVNTPIDLILNVTDSTNLERNLNLTLQLQELGIPMLLVLNISDEAHDKGIHINEKQLGTLLGVQIIKTVATWKKNIMDLKSMIWDTLKEKQVPENWTSGELRKKQETLSAVLSKRNQPYPVRWLALRLLDKDKDICTEFREQIEDRTHPIGLASPSFKEQSVTDLRYKKTEEITRLVQKNVAVNKVDWTSRLDSVLLHRVWGLAAFFLFMWLMFKMTFDISGPFVDWIDQVTTGPVHHWTGALLHMLSAPDWAIALGTDGVIGGVGFVLAFTPVIFVIMFFISFLEGSGYMARAAFLMDGYMQKIGLPGKAFIPLLLGFGCNVPSIYATRTLDSTRDRILTAMITPFMSCGARLPVYILFIAAFFPRHSGIILWAIYTLGLFLAVLTGLFLKKTILKGSAPCFIMELPPYRLPSMKQLLMETWEKGKHFLQKAGTFILAVSIVVWFLFNLPWGVENPRDSLLGKLGGTVVPVLKPLGFGSWEAGASLLTGIVAKEIVVGTMGEIYTAKGKEITEHPSLKEELFGIGTGFFKAIKGAFVNILSTIQVSSLSSDPPEGGLVSKVRMAFTPLQAISFMVFVLLYMPCMVTGVAMKQEFGTWKWFGLATATGVTLAWTMSFVIYQGGLLLGWGG